MKQKEVRKFLWAKPVSPDLNGTPFTDNQKAFDECVIVHVAGELFFTTIQELLDQHWNLLDWKHSGWLLSKMAPLADPEPDVPEWLEEENAV